MDRASSRQRSKVSVPIPTSRATTSIAALSGGNNRATALSLNVCPYRANGDDNKSHAGGNVTWCAWPRVSDDNAYAESLFRTARYRPEFPAKGFANLDAALAWGDYFVAWYNTEHRHSGLRYVSPAQRRAGDNVATLAARHNLFLKARDLHPARWSGATRDWTPDGPVTLNPERDSDVAACADASTRQPLAA